MIILLLTCGLLLILSDPSDDSYAKDNDENKDDSEKYHYCRICKINVYE